MVRLERVFKAGQHSANDDLAQIKTSEQAVQQDVSSLKDRLAQDEKANADLQGDLTVVTKKLKITQGQLKNSREEAAKLNDATTQKLTALDTSVHTEPRRPRPRPMT